MSVARAAVLTLAIASVCGAQSQYYNLDAGRPVRVEDAEVTARYALGFDLAPLQAERISGGTMKVRAEPRFAYGVLPFTDVEVRLPVVRLVPPRGTTTSATTGLAGVAIGAMHAFNLETGSVPAIAVSGELALPVGSLAPPHASYIAKALFTKTTRVGRVHLNAGGGSWSVHTAAVTDSACANTPRDLNSLPRIRGGCGSGPPIIIDTPCDMSPMTLGAGPLLNRACAAPTITNATTAEVAAPLARGRRWFAGIGFDHAVPLRSIDLIADVYTERFRGLYAKADWTAEVGFRHQLTPLVVIDAGSAWHFAGTVRSASLTIGALYELATPPLALH